MTLVLVLSGCQAVSNASSSAAQIRIIDANAEAAELDLYAGATALAYNVGFGTVTSYVPVAPADYLLHARAAGSRAVTAGVRSTLADRQQYTLLVSNTVAGPQNILLQDQNVPAPAGQIALRILDQAVRPGSVDVYLLPEGKSQALLLVQGLQFGSSTTYLPAPAGTYRVVVAGSEKVQTSSSLAMFTGTFTTYSVGAVRTLILLDRTSASTSGVQVITASDYDSP